MIAIFYPLNHGNCVAKSKSGWWVVLINIAKFARELNR